MYIAILFSLYKAFGLRVMIAVLIGTCFAVLFADQLSASILRPWLGRLRPAHPENPISEFVHIVDGHRGGSYGFPSSHAANTFAVATLLSLIFRHLRFTIAIFFWALLNCYSRIYLGMHYPGDLIVGSLIGIVFGLLIYLCLALSLGRKPTLRWKREKPDFPLTRVVRSPFLLFPSDIVIFIEVLTLGSVCIAYLFTI